MKSAALLRVAATTVDNRRESYGEPAAFFRQVARRWSITLGVDVTAHQVVRCMIDLKQERLAKEPNHQDSKVDIAGYAGILAELDEWGNRMPYGDRYINPDYQPGDKIYCPPTVEDNLIQQRNVRRLDRWDRAAGMKSDFVGTINRACRDYSEQR